jgi:Glycolipid 2-alpha-mannosyltransferase
MFMKENDKVYGFTLALYESEKTIPTLWDVTKGEQTSTQPLSSSQQELNPMQNSSGNTRNTSLRTTLWDSCPIITGSRITSVTVSAISRVIGSLLNIDG